MLNAYLHPVLDMQKLVVEVLNGRRVDQSLVGLVLIATRSRFRADCGNV